MRLVKQAVFVSRCMLFLNKRSCFLFEFFGRCNVPGPACNGSFMLPSFILLEGFEQERCVVELVLLLPGG